MKNKNPLFKFKYVEGLGDFVRCIIHSNIVKFFIKKIEYCDSCSNRAYALNLLVSFPIWKLFFKTKEDMKNSFKKEVEDYGYTYIENENQEENIISNINEFDPNAKIETFDNNQIKYDGFYCLSKTENDFDYIKIVTLIFKKN
jgi:hypothetical protein